MKIPSNWFLCAILLAHPSAVIAAKPNYDKLVRQIERSRGNARERILKAGDSAVPALKRCLKNPSYTRRRSCLRVLSVMKSEQAYDAVFFAATNDPDWTNRDLAVVFMAKFYFPKVKNDLYTIFQSTVHHRVRITALRKLSDRSGIVFIDAADREATLKSYREVETDIDRFRSHFESETLLEVALELGKVLAKHRDYRGRSLALDTIKNHHKYPTMLRQALDVLGATGKLSDIQFLESLRKDRAYNRHGIDVTEAIEAIRKRGRK